MTNTEYYRAVLLGVVLGMSTLSLFYMIGVATDVKEPPQNGVKSTNFEVVDTYKGCDVVQWYRSSLAEYKYFLHCNNTRPVYEK
jgi:hypothetical protein